MLKVDSLEVGYGESVVIRGVSLSVGERDAVGVIGRNGMGKTTLLKAIVGLLPASAGRIEFGGVDITRLPTYERVRLGIGFVPQGRLLFPAGTRKNPLEVVSLSKRLLFFDARDGRQVARARELIARYDGKVKPILTGGSYLDLMKAWRVPVYYDQQGTLTRRFGIRQVPALVSQEGMRLRVDEVLVQ